MMNDLFIPVTDVSKWRWINVSIGNAAYSATLTAQWSNDGITWENLKMYPMTTLNVNDVSSAGVVSTTNIVNGTFVSFKYFQMIATAYTSGTPTGFLQLFKDGLPGFQMLVSQAALVDSLFARIGLTNNDGIQHTVIAAGHSADTVINSNNSFLASVLVTAQGTNQMEFYDNASAGTGDIIGLVPANQPVDGIPIPCKAPCTLGITAKGDAANPGVTVFYVNL